MKKETISFKHKGATLELTYAFPESMHEVYSLIGAGIISEGTLLRAIKNELLVESKNALIGRTRRFKRQILAYDPYSELGRQIQSLLRSSKSASVRESDGAQASAASVSSADPKFEGVTTEAQPEASEIL